MTEDLHSKELGWEIEAAVRRADKDVPKGMALTWRYDPKWDVIHLTLHSHWLTRDPHNHEQITRRWAQAEVAVTLEAIRRARPGLREDDGLLSLQVEYLADQIINQESTR